MGISRRRWRGFFATRSWANGFLVRWVDTLDVFTDADKLSSLDLIVAGLDDG